MRAWTAIVFAGLVVSTENPLAAESTARQSFLVNVPRRLVISAPAAAPQVEMAEDAIQVTLPTQVWSVAANSHEGATVTLSTVQSFHNLDDDTIRRDAQLEVTVQNQSQARAWSVTHSIAITDHQTGQEEATVEVRSAGPGTADIGLKISLQSTSGQFTPAGDYSTTVIGTITAN